MNTISKIILSTSLVSIPLILWFHKENEQTISTTPTLPEPKIDDNIVKIKNWVSKVPSSSGDTTLNPIIMFTRYNNIENANNRVLIPVGMYKNNIERISDLIVKNIRKNEYNFETKHDGKTYYITFSKNTKNNLEKGQLFWTLDEQEKIDIYQNDKNILFQKNTDNQIYFKWYGNNVNNRQTDAGFFILHNKNYLLF